MVSAPVSDAETYAALLWLTRCHVRDRLAGGVPAACVGAVVGCHPSTAQTHLRNLIDRGAVVSVHGIAPADDEKDADAPRARVSYLPVGHADAPTDDADERRVRP